MKTALLLSVLAMALALLVEASEPNTKRIDDDYNIEDDEDVQEEDNHKTSRRAHAFPTSRLRIEASHTTTSKKELVAKPRLMFMMPGMDILGAMMHPMLMMLGMASFVSMMPTVVQNVGNMVPNLFPLVGNSPPAAAAAPPSKGKIFGRWIPRFGRWRRSVDPEEDVGPSVVRLTENVLDLWEKVEKAIEKVEKIHTK